MPTNCQSKWKYQSAINVNRRDVTRFDVTKVDVKRNSDVTKFIRNNRDVVFSSAPTMYLYGLKPTNESASNMVTWGSWPIQHRPLVCLRPNERSVETMLKPYLSNQSDGKSVDLTNEQFNQKHKFKRAEMHHN